MDIVPQAVLYPASMLAPRTLGDDLAPPRETYYFLFPAVLALAAIISWTLDNQTGMALASVAATAIGLVTLWQWLFCKAPTRFSTLLSMSLLLGYGGGALNSWLTLSRGHLTLAEVYGLGDGVLARGIAAVLISSSALYFFGEIYEKPIFGRDFHFQAIPRMRPLIYFGTMAILAGYATDALDVGGVTAQGGRVSIPGLFLGWLYEPLLAFSIMAFFNAKNGRSRVLIGLSALVLLAMFSAMGRRTSVYSTIEILFVLGLAGFRWLEKPFRNFLLVLGLGSIIVVTSLTFMLFRIANNTAPAHHQLTLQNRVQVAGKIIQRSGAGEAYFLAGTATRKNLQSRTLVLAFFANILDASSRKTPALGNDARIQVETAIPRMLDREKSKLLGEEELVDQQFGFGYNDEANSIITAGATDFGLIGVVLYPLAIVVTTRSIFNLLARWFTIVPLMFVTLSLIFLMLQTEITLTAYCEAIRDCSLFGSVVAIFMVLPSVKRHGLRTKYD